MINIKSYLLMGMLSLAHLHAGAQEVSYTTLRDDPQHIAKLIVHINPFYADPWGTNISMGYGMTVGYEYKDKASFIFDWRKSYMEINWRPHVSGIGPADPLQKFQYLELGGDYHFIDKEKSGTLKIVLSSVNSGNRTYTSYIMVPGKHRKIRSVRFGAQSIRTAIKVQKSKLTASGYDIKGYSGNDVKEFSEFENAYGMMNFIAFNAGVSMKNITNLLVAIPNGSRKKKLANANINNLYFDYLYAPSIVFSQVITPDLREWQLRSVNPKHAGWRLGWSFKSSSRSAMAFKFEFGSRPGFYGTTKGVTGANLYLLMDMGWTIPFKL